MISKHNMPSTAGSSEPCVKHPLCAQASYESYARASMSLVLRLSPIIKALNTLLGVLTWSGEDTILAIGILITFWFLCFREDLLFLCTAIWASNFLILGLWNRFVTSSTGSNEQDQHTRLGQALNEFACLETRLSICRQTFESCYNILTWQNKPATMLFVVVLVRCMPLFMRISRTLTTRVVILCVGTWFLTRMSPWYDATYGWLFRRVDMILGISFSTAMTLLISPAPLDTLRLPPVPVVPQCSGKREEKSNSSSPATRKAIHSKRTRKIHDIWS